MRVVTPSVGGFSQEALVRAASSIAFGPSAVKVRSGPTLPAQGAEPIHTSWPRS